MSADDTRTILSFLAVAALVLFAWLLFAWSVAPVIGRLLERVSKEQTHEAQEAYPPEQRPSQVTQVRVRKLSEAEQERRRTVQQWRRFEQWLEQESEQKTS